MVGRAGESGRFGWARVLSALLAAAALTLCVAASGGSEKGDVTLKIGARDTPEEEVLGHIYALALQRAGYEVKGDFGIDTEFGDVPFEELKIGRISGFPEHLNTALDQQFELSEELLPSDSRKAYVLAEEKLKKEKLMAFPPTSFSLNRPVAVMRKTAEANDLKTISDLKGKAEKMTLSGPTDCHFARDCLAGMELLYGVYFESISYTYSEKQVRDRYKVLEDGDFDASIVFSTDGRLAADKGKFVTLEDDKHVAPAGNVVFVTSQKVVDEAGPEFEAAILAAQRGLTLPVMQRLDAEVELEKKSPAAVAAAFLKRTGAGAD